MEIITGVERRRRWRDEDKLRVLAETEQPGARTSEVARRHDISRGLLWYWRRQLRQGRLVVPGAPEPVFLPGRPQGVARRRARPHRRPPCLQARPALAVELDASAYSPASRRLIVNRGPHRVGTFSPP